MNPTSVPPEGEPSPASPAPDPARARRPFGIYPSPPLHWVGDGFRVAGYFSLIPDAARRLDPFLMLDYHPPYTYEPAARARGVGVHPHRGFETVTLAWQGRVAHHDSSGGGGVIGPGDVQWMTAASGVLHKEYHEESFARQGGTFHMAQLWVNLPAKHKMDPPRYQALTASQMGQVALPNAAGHVRIIAGEYAGTRGPALTFSPMSVLDVHVNAAAPFHLPIPPSWNAAALVMKGDVTLPGGERAAQNDFIVFGKGGDHIEMEAGTDTQLLVLCGEPLAEPIVQYGPFVMNTKREIEQAFLDLQQGKFGQLED